MRRTVGLALGLALCLASRASAQVAATTTTTAVTTATTAAPVTTGRTFWDLLAGCQAHCEKCRQRCCQTQFGMMLSAMCQPFSFATGGLFPPLCPDVPSAADLARLADPNDLTSPAEAAAAKIKADVAGMAARRAAVRYLATVDCHYYPEAEKALIASLRADRLECVRLDAAIALGSGCCCTKNTVEALALAAYGGTSDGNPMETSDRVKNSALHSLHLCMSRYCGVETGTDTQPLPPELPPEVPPVPAPGVPPPVVPPGVGLPVASRRIVPQPAAPEHIIAAARALAATAGTNRDPYHVPTGQRGLFQLIDHAWQPLQVREEINYEEAALQAPIHRSVRTLAEQPQSTLPRPAVGFIVGQD